jgi:hypothetical protein
VIDMPRKYTQTPWNSSMRDLLSDLLRTAKKSKSTKKNFMFTYGLSENQYKTVRRKARSIRKK